MLQLIVQYCANVGVKEHCGNAYPELHCQGLSQMLTINVPWLVVTRIGVAALVLDEGKNGQGQSMPIAC